MIRHIEPNRRSLLAAGAAALAASAASLAPVMAANAAAQGGTPIAQLWAEAQTLREHMTPYAEDIANLADRAGLPGWMHLGGEANRLGNRRYDKLVAILKTSPESVEDLATLGATMREAEIQQGPATWARFQFDAAARAYYLAA